MTYELAKKLKEAGFPKIGTGERFILGGKIEKDSRDGRIGLYAPTLSELIEACGEEFMGIDRTFNVERDKFNSWEATQKTYCCHEHGESREYGYGSTPEEAVANLWLALNKK